MNTELYKEKFIDELQEQLWRKEVNLAYDETKIPEIKKLQDEKFIDLDAMKRTLESLDPLDKTKAVRVKRKELESQIEKAQEFIVSCDETISLINETSRKDKEKIKNLKERVEFVRTFEYPIDDYADQN